MGTVSTKTVTVVFFETQKMKNEDSNQDACIRCYTSILWAKYNWCCIFAVGNRRAGIHTHRQKVSQIWVCPSCLCRPILGPIMVRYKTGVVPPVAFYEPYMKLYTTRSKRAPEGKPTV